MNAKPILATLLASAAILLYPPISEANVLYSTLGPSGQFDSSGGWVVAGSDAGSQVIAMPFTPSSSQTMADAVLALGWYSSYSNYPVSLYLESDNGGVPGSILDTLTQVGTIPALSASYTGGGLVSFDCGSSCQMLDAGTPYWLVAQQSDASSTQSWMYAYNDTTGTYEYNESDSATGPWNQFNNHKLSGFRVDGVSSVPEPATIALVGLGLLGLGFSRRKRAS